jgi:hypothetical protein
MAKIKPQSVFKPTKKGKSLIKYIHPVIITTKRIPALYFISERHLREV